MTLELQADCSRCAGLCCVVPAFVGSADFALTKPAGTPCPNLQQDFRCGVHTELRPLGFPGCTVYDCFGAGQAVTAEFAGANWRTPSVAGPMFLAFQRRREEHELRWYVREALLLETPVYEELLAITSWIREAVNPLLLKASEHARAGLKGPELRAAELVGADLRRRELVGASLRGAVLVGADLRGVDLSFADMTGADLRGTDLRGAQLEGALFLLQSQLDSAKGDQTTSIPAGRRHPGHWGSLRASR